MKLDHLLTLFNVHEQKIVEHALVEIRQGIFDLSFVLREVFQFFGTVLDRLYYPHENVFISPRQ